VGAGWRGPSGAARTSLRRRHADILYARCSRPLVDEIDRLRWIVGDNEIGFAVFD
jgi:hypothetical protein